jgi:uncharacterized delta-60 repeat protein
VAVGALDSFPLQQRGGGIVLIRYLPDGTPDPSFGAGGRVETAFGIPPAGSIAIFATPTIVVQPDGTLAVAGGTATGTGDFALAVYLPDGRLDPRFGRQGTVTTDFAGGSDVANGLLRQDDGRLVLTGYATAADGLHELALARYLADVPTTPPLDDDAQFVADLYQNLLNRTASADERNALRDVMEGDRFRALGATATAFATSDEARGRVIAGYYQTFLGRTAGAAEVAGWVGAQHQGATPEQVLAVIVGSEEYFQRAGGTNAGWLDQLYRDLLGRDRDPGSQPFLDALNENQLSRVQVATILLGSLEYRQHAVAQLYTRFLGRTPAAGETDFWVRLLGQPSAGPGHAAPGEQVEAGIAASAEAFTHAGASNRAWLDHLYQSLLGRLPDAGGFNGHLQGIETAYLAARQGVATLVITSDEYHRNVVASYYNRFLARAAAPAEVDFWASALRQGATEEQVLAQILGSDEYLRRVQVPSGQTTNQAYVAQLYQEFFRRAVDSGGQVFIDCLNRNLCTRDQVALVVLTSPEERDMLVRRIYASHLGRLPTGPELAAASTALAAGVRQEVVLAGILASNTLFDITGQNRFSGVTYP